MKNVLSIIIIYLITSFQLMAVNPFNKGVNLTGWFGAGNAKSVPFSKYTQKDLAEIKSLGCDVIRLPITLHYMTNGAPNYIIDPLFFQYLDQVIAWTDALDLKLVIDNHTIEVAKSKDVEIPLLKIWGQMAAHYKDFSTNIYFEILNEPNELLPTDWEAIQAKVVDTIRSIDTKHTIIVTGAEWGGIYGLTSIKKLADANLIYTFHFYDPFLFTHQGASWASLTDMGNVPFPYVAARMPTCPTSLLGTWVETSINTGYKTEGTVTAIKSAIDKAIKFSTDNNVKIYCGELGVYTLKSPDIDRIEWYRAVVAYLNEKQIPWTMWDYQGGFGIFNKGSNETFEYDINRPMAEAMGFTIPPFKKYVMRADTVPFTIYNDYVGENIIQGGLPSVGTVDFMATGAHNGSNAIHITELNQYNAADFDFKFNKNLAKLVAAQYVIEGWVKCDVPSAKITLRFIDTKTTDPADHPWRKDYTLSESPSLLFNNQWQRFEIPLASFVDIGSWDGAWYNSANLFNWKAVDRFQIVSENMPLNGINFWFDDIRIKEGPNTPPEPINSDETGLSNNNNDALISLYPNPATNSFTINVSEPGTISVSLYNLSGQQLIKTFATSQSNISNSFHVNFNTLNNSVLPNGIYICKIQVKNKVYTEKLTIIGQTH